MGSPISCREMERLLVFYVCDELGDEERAAVEKHISRCTACATLLAQQIRLRQAVESAQQPAERLDPSGALLAQCRSELADALDDARSAPAGPRWLRALHPSDWFAASFLRHPARGAALLVLLGVAVGLVAPQWYRSQMTEKMVRPEFTVWSGPRVSDQDLQTMDIAGINWAPESGAGSPRVELQLTAQKPLLLQGSLDDADVKRVLTYVVQNGQRFDPGVRLDSLDILRTRTSDADVRRALCAAARKDRNAGVRLKAVEALRGFEQEDAVSQTLLDVLANDANPGVRVEAINSLQGVLRALAEEGGAPDNQRVLQVLRDRTEKDPNNYVRMQSAAAMRQLGPRQLN